MDIRRGGPCGRSRDKVISAADTCGSAAIDGSHAHGARLQQGMGRMRPVFRAKKLLSGRTAWLRRSVQSSVEKP